MPKSLFASYALAFTFFSAAVLAQPTGGPPDLDREAIKRGIRMVEERFDAEGPQLGDSMADLTLLQANGEVVELREVVRGRYSVFVLGCLT